MEKQLAGHELLYLVKDISLHNLITQILFLFSSAKLDGRKQHLKIQPSKKKPR